MAKSSDLLRRLLRCVACLAPFGSVAQTPPAQLAPFFTTATRTPAEPETLGTAFDSLSAAELARRQVNSLAGALGSAVGAPLFASGASGGSSSLFLRGSNSNQTLFLVDGIRLNDPNTDYAVFLGGACVSACDSLEISHGPQSTLYGGEAMGGVVSLRAQRGAGAAGGRVVILGVLPQGAKIEIEPFDLLFREISLLYSFLNPFTQARAATLIASGTVQVAKLITRQIPLDRAAQAISQPPLPDDVKVLILP